MQYIGARYVPKFMGLYDATQAYEALCVVDNGMGTSYITKVPTPAGTPLTDTDYYAVYGASSGAIINLQNQIGDISDLTTADQSNLVNAVNEVDFDLQNLTNDFNHYVNPPRVFAVITDSYGTTPAATHGFLDELESKITAAGYGFYGLGSGGSGFHKVGTLGKFINVFQDLETSFSDPSAITDIVICGGNNDVGESISDVRNEYTALKAYFDANYPNAKVHCAFTGNNLNLPATPSMHQSYISLIDAMSDICNNFAKWRMIHGIEYIMHAANLFAYGDPNHPNAVGATFIGDALASSLLKNCNFDFRLTNTGTAKLANGTGVTYIASFNNDKVTISIPQMSADSSDSYNFITTMLVNVGTLSPIYVKNAGLAKGEIVRWASTQSGVFAGKVFLDGGNIKWESIDPTARSNQTGVLCEGFDITFDTLFI